MEANPARRYPSQYLQYNILLWAEDHDDLAACRHHNYNIENNATLFCISNRRLAAHVTFFMMPVHATNDYTSFHTDLSHWVSRPRVLAAGLLRARSSRHPVTTSTHTQARRTTTRHSRMSKSLGIAFAARRHGGEHHTWQSVLYLAQSSC